jgi:4-amino-4-deoxy-L-arabinose transferase-like glycosyltransferase
MNRRSSLVTLALIFFVACAIRISTALRCDAVPDFSDMAFYNQVAMGPGFPKSLPPGYPLFLRAIYGVFGAYNYRAVYVVQAIISALTVLLVYWVARKAGNRNAGLIAAGIAAVYPNLIAFNLTTMTDTIGVFSVMLLLAVLVASIDEKKKSISAAIVFLLGFTFRPAFILFAPGALLSLEKRRVFILAFIVLLAPAVAFETFIGDTFHRSAVATYETYDPALDGVNFISPDSTELGSNELPSYVYLKAALKNIMQNKDRAIENIYNKTAVLLARGWDSFVLQPVVGRERFWLYVMTYAYLPVLVLGFIGMSRLYGRNSRMLALPALGYLAFAITFFLFKLRYRLMIEPVLIMFAAMFIARDRAPAGSPVGEAPAKVDEARGGFRGDRGILAAILLVALALRICFAFARSAPFISPALAEYNRLALEGGIGSSTAPLYPLFLRAIYSLFGAGNYTALFFVQGILGAIVVVLMYTTFARLCGRTAGMIAAALSALFPDFIVYCLSVRAEWMSVLVVAALMATTAGRLGARRKAALSAALIALGMLVEPLLVFLAPGAFLASRKKKLFVLVLLLALAPFVVINAVRFQKIEPVYEASAFGLGSDENAITRGWRHAIDGVYGNVGAVLTRGRGEDQAVGNGARRTGPGAASYAYVVVMFLGLVGLARRYRREQARVVLPVLGYIGILVLFSRFQMPYRVPLEPVLIGYAAALLGGRTLSSVCGEEA